MQQTGLLQIQRHGSGAGACEVLTCGLARQAQRLRALRASRPAAITLRGLLVLVQLVMAAMMTAPSGICASACVHSPAPFGCQIAGLPGEADWKGRLFAHHAGQVKAQRTFVFGHSPGCLPTDLPVWRVVLDQLHLCGLPPLSGRR